MVKKKTPGRPRTVDPTGKTAGRRNITLRVTDAQHDRMRKHAQLAGITVSELVRRLVAA